MSAATSHVTTRRPARVVAGIPLHEMDLHEAAERICALALEGHGGYVCTPNVDYLVRAKRDPGFRAALLGASLRLPDGMGVVYGSLIAGDRLRASLTGRRLPTAVSTRLAAHGRSVALFGAGPGVAEAAAEAIRDAGGVVTDAFGPGRPFQVGSEEDRQAVQRLSAGEHSVVFCALGAPRQELWMARNRVALHPRVLVGVGAAFDVLAGRSPEAPAWMSQIGLEWLHRLAREPRRLARRYLLDDPPFFWWMLKRRLRRTKSALRSSSS